MSSARSSRVLSLYRRILRASRAWDGPQNEKEYIWKEAQVEFRKHRDLLDTEDIDQKIFDGESRLQMGVHYKIPYPRLHHRVATHQYIDVPVINFKR